LIKTNLAPLSFTEVPVKTYTDAMLGVYEMMRIDMFKDVFIWAGAVAEAMERQRTGQAGHARLTQAAKANVSGRALSQYFAKAG
jgi:hypothetical protein